MISGMLLWNKKIINDMSFEKHRGSFVLTYREKPDNMYQALHASTALHADKTAVVDDYGRNVSYRKLLEMTDVFSAYLYHTCGVRKGTHVGLLLYNSLEFCVAFFSLCRLGAISVPIPTKCKPMEQNAILQQSDLSLLICDGDYLEGIRNTCEILSISLLPCRGDAKVFALEAYKCEKPLPAGRMAAIDDDVILMFTSGTTSMSKGVLLNNLNLMHAIISYRYTLDLTEADVSVIPIPMYHITGLAALLCLFIYLGGTLYLHKKFDAQRVLACVQDGGVTFLHASPTVFLKLYEQHEDYPLLPTLKKFACGSANMPVKLLTEIKKWLPQISFRTVYGLTETCSPASVFPCDVVGSPHVGASGIPIPGVLMKVTDEHGKELPCGYVGELQVRGSVVLERYYKLDSDLIKDQWLKTGDLAKLSDDGYVTIVDRKKDMINRGGEKVWSYEVENQLCEYDGIREAAVVGIPDAVYGETVAALIRPEAGATPTLQEIREFLLPRLAKFKIPTVCQLTDQIPKTPGGKADKNKIRELFATPCEQQT